MHGKNLFSQMYLVVLHPEKCARAFTTKKKRKTVKVCFCISTYKLFSSTVHLFYLVLNYIFVFFVISFKLIWVVKCSFCLNCLNCLHLICTRTHFLKFFLLVNYPFFCIFQLRFSRSTDSSVTVLSDEEETTYWLELIIIDYTIDYYELLLIIIEK